MKNYLSFGAGVNSVAAYFLGGFDEAVFCDPGCEYPETYEFLNRFVAKYPLTIIKPKWGNLYEYSWDHKMVPATWPRWCTVHFKIKPFADYVEKPCFKGLAFATDEAHRAKISIDNDIEHRFPLLESNVSREDCKNIIKKAGLPIPHRSKCWFCPFQTISEWKQLRMNHSDLFCKAEQLEKRNMNYRISKGKKPFYLYGNAKPLRTVVDENQMRIFREDEYPPCECML
jgi:3'-phosphoadenosine 5'-phosphosulfate sulfotransferase (PAPS reductase)/FAD synthetase